MKTSVIRCTTLGLLLAVTSNLQAQFFKELLNTAKQTAQSRANSKTSETTNKAIDKVDPSASGKSKTNPGTTTSPASQPIGDTAATNTVLGAFVKAAQQNPNDTSSADLTMKALGLMVSGGGVSAQDSAAAINSFKTASGGAGLHYGYRMVTSGPKFSTITDTTNMYFTNSGEGRVEMRLPMPGVQTNEMISIGRVKERQYTILLYPETKTYVLNIIDTNLLKSRDTYQVTKLGTETIQGYSCTHARVLSTTGKGMFKSTSTIDVWTSPSVPGYAVFKAMTNLHTSDAGIFAALENAGCGGVMVKMSIASKDASMDEELIRAEKKNYSGDFFQIPPGYAESQENMFSHMMKQPPAKK